MTSSKKSTIWAYFTICQNDKQYAQCIVCNSKISRGGEGKKAGTSAMRNHLKSKHKKEFNAMRNEDNSVSSKNVPVVPSIQLQSDLPTLMEILARKQEHSHGPQIMNNKFTMQISQNDVTTYDMPSEEEYCPNIAVLTPDVQLSLGQLPTPMPPQVRSSTPLQPSASSVKTTAASSRISSPAGTLRRSSFRSRTRRKLTPFERAMTHFVSVEQARLQMEEIRDKRQHDIEQQRLQLEEARDRRDHMFRMEWLGLQRHLNTTMEAFVNMTGEIIELIRHH